MDELDSGSILDVEKPLQKLEEKIEELKRLNAQGTVDLSEEIALLEGKALKLKQRIFRNFSPWEKVQIARHAKRPSTLDYVRALMTDFVELHGDRLFADDAALVGGFARFEGEKVVVIGHQKGKDTRDNLHRNFGMVSPEGFRKAARLMRLAEKFKLPVITFIDTPGAYPGVGAEERGQFLAIAENLMLMSKLRTPIIACVIGQGGSGGALAIGVGDAILILEHAVYSVISPEGCASILWRDGKKAPEAASFLRMTARELMSLGLVDEIIPEPLGGAHRDVQQIFKNVKDSLAANLARLKAVPSETLLPKRYEKFRKMGVVLETSEALRS